MAKAVAFSFIAVILLAAHFTISQPPVFAQASTQNGSRPGYIYDYANVISPQYRKTIDSYLRGLDDATTDEIVIFTIKSFEGHGIKKDGIELHERDALANYIFNELPLDGVKGIGKKGKDNGVLVFMSLTRDSAGGSLRIEVGRGLEGNITDGTAGKILDNYLVPARQRYMENTNNTSVFGKAFLNTAVALGSLTGYKAMAPSGPIPTSSHPRSSQSDDNKGMIIAVVFIVAVIGIGVLSSKFGRGGRRGYGGYYMGGGWGGGSGGGGGGFGGGGGDSGGGGAGR